MKALNVPGVSITVFDNNEILWSKGFGKKNKETGEDTSLLKQSSAQTMMTRVPNAGGIGVGIDGEGMAFRFRHTGGNAGFTCYAVSFATSGRGVVIMTNSDNGFPLIHEIVRTVAREYGWPPMFMRE